MHQIISLNTTTTTTTTTNTLTPTHPLVILRRVGPAPWGHPGLVPLVHNQPRGGLGVGEGHLPACCRVWWWGIGGLSPCDYVLTPILPPWYYISHHPS